MSQNDRILQYLHDGGSITDGEARDIFGCHRLSARIYDIRALGFDVRMEMEQGVNRFGEKTRYARYWLNKRFNGFEGAEARKGG